MIELVKQIAELSFWEFCILLFILIITFFASLIIIGVIEEIIFKGKSSEPNKSDEKTDK